MLSSYAALNPNNRRYIAYRPCPDLQGRDHNAAQSTADRTQPSRLARYRLSSTVPTGSSMASGNPRQQCACQGVLQATELRHEGVDTLGQIRLMGQARHLGQTEFAGEETPIGLSQVRRLTRHHTFKIAQALQVCRCVAPTSTPFARASL